ncbi:MAG: 16S rRNA (guanine(527)-N(7))-methyltransferase RsmG [Gemmatimonadetes bacterium]|nr:16S rRNA (guanine(527)-N(7))-methyltransferase RsmG [Gemmatimonadota bacterium]MDE3257388.1 16S rRNA (guanine(527)-N(7))-methyltransferase RsmG [Gemmatimonadota bacterium]
MNDQEFLAAAEALSVPLSDEQAALFNRYEALLRTWCGRVRLVSRGDRDRIRERHFIDSLRVTPFLPRGKISLLDLGSGAGFPGVPVKIARPEVKVVLLESARMKGLFLNHLAGELSLDGLSVLTERAEAACERAGHRGRYDIVTARAVGSLPDLWRLSSGFLNKDGELLAMKGPGALREMEEFGRDGPDVSVESMAPGSRHRNTLLVRVSARRE